MVPVRHQGELLGALSINKRPGEAPTPVEQKLLTDLPVVVGLLYVDGPLAASENGSEQTALQDGSACDYDPRAETAGPTLLTGTSNNDRETMRDIISARRRDTS